MGEGRVIYVSQGLTCSDAGFASDEIRQRAFDDIVEWPMMLTRLRRLGLPCVNRGAGATPGVDQRSRHISNGRYFTVDGLASRLLVLSGAGG